MTPEVIHTATKLIARDVASIDDIRSSAHYRLKVSENILSDFLKEDS